MSKTSRKKIIWLPLWPNRNIYVPIFNELGKNRKDWELKMIVPKIATNYAAGEKHFSIDYLEHKEYNKIFFFDYLKRKAKNESIDVTTTMALKGLVKKLYAEKPDVVIVNMEYSLYTLQAAYYCFKTNTPLIVQTETKIITGFRKFAHSIYMKMLLGLFSKNIKAITCWSSPSYAFMKNNFGNKKNIGVYLLPPAVDTKTFHPMSKSKKNTKLMILDVSRFAPYKRHVDLLDAAVHLRKKNNLDFQIDLLGEGPTKELIISKVNQLNLQDKVRFLPKQDFFSMNKLYSSYDILVLPSFNEAIGMVVPEAMACATPVIVSDTAGAVTYVDNNKTGFIFKTFDSIDLANKILLFKDKNKLKKMSDLAAKDVSQRFKVEKIANDFEKIISESLKN